MKNTVTLQDGTEVEMLTSAELFYLMGVVEMDAHDERKDTSAKLFMQLLRKLERMYDQSGVIEAEIFKHRLVDQK